jgi:WXG100 family type VII secretion target
MMSARFLVDPDAMRDMAGRFDMHAHTVEDGAHTMWASRLNVAGPGWGGAAQSSSHDLMDQINQAHRNIGPRQVDREGDAL